MTTRSATSVGSALRPVVAGVILGALGLIGGYFAPLWLNPYSNIGPLTGIFFSGPFGLAAGLILGHVAYLLGWSSSRFAASVGLAGGALVMCTLFLSLPEDRWEADVVEGQVLACSSPISFEARVIRNWEDSIRINPQKRVAATWRKDARTVLASSSDYVADVRITSKSAVYFGRKPWNKGTLFITQEPPPAGTERFVVPASFCGPTRSSSRRFLARWPEFAGFPPTTPASLLQLQTLEPVPPDVAALADRRASPN